MAKIVYESKKKPITHITDDETLMTVYDLEYKKKSTPRTLPYCPPELMPELRHELPNPISEAFRQELLPDYERNTKANEEYESGTEYFQRLKNKKPSIVKVVDKEVDQNALTDDHKMNDGRTVYQIDYCTVDDYTSLNPASVQPKPIPDVWKPPPLSLYRLNYRDHNKMATWNIVPDAAKEPPSFFDPNPRERELLNVRTPKTQYQAVIGRLGDEIIKRQYHGRIEPLPGEYVPTDDDRPPLAPPSSPKSES